MSHIFPQEKGRKLFPPIKKKKSREEEKDVPLKKTLLTMLHIIPVVFMPVFIEVCELIIQSAIFVVVIPFILPSVFI